jgi:hypothetical protein
VADVGSGVKGGQSSGRDAGGVALDEHPIGSFVDQDRFETGQHAGRDLGRRLIVLHHVQVVVRLDGKDAQHLVEHFAVLGGDANSTDDALRVARQLADHRAELDSFGPRAEDREHLERHAWILALGTAHAFWRSVHSGGLLCAHPKKWFF